jgi:hypothetical protein
MCVSRMFKLFETAFLKLLKQMSFDEENGKKFIRSLSFEEDIITASGRFLKFQDSFGITPPVFLTISLLGVGGHVMATKNDYRNVRELPIDRRDLLLPEIVIEQFDQDLSLLLRHAFDSVWQAAGFLRSPYYDEAGNRKKQS